MGSEYPLPVRADELEVSIAFVMLNGPSPEQIEAIQSVNARRACQPPLAMLQLTKEEYNLIFGN